MAKILVVEDEKALADSIAEWLAGEGHRLHSIYNGDAALELLKRESDFDIIILDIMLPGLGGLELCRQYRGHGGNARILMVTSRGSVSDKEDGLDSGADDYLTKPFDLKELSARVRALMRRSVSVVGAQLSLADIIMDIEKRQVYRAGNEIKLLPQEFALLEFLMRHPDRIFSPEILIKRVWHGNSTIDTVRTHIKTLRKKVDLPGMPELIKTMHGVGYTVSARG